MAGERTSQETIEQLLPTIRSDMVFESDQIRDAGFENLFRMRESNSVEQNAVALAKFLDLDLDASREITSNEYLYVD